MRAAAETYVPDGGASWKGGAQTFIHKGINGRWKDILSLEELKLYELACDKALSHRLPVLVGKWWRSAMRLIFRFNWQLGTFNEE